MEINCSYCEKCDTLWDDKEIENGLCFDCQEPVIKMVARPVAASQQGVQPTVLCTCGADDDPFLAGSNKECPAHYPHSG